MPIDLQKLRKDDEQLVLEWFPDHKATLTVLPDPSGDVTKLVWSKPGTGINRIYYLILHNMLFVGGDLGDGVYVWPSTLTLSFLAGCELDYFAGKCRASDSEPRGKSWRSERVEAWIEEQLGYWAEENPIPCPACCTVDALRENPDPEAPCPTCKGEETVPRTPLTFQECAELMHDEDCVYLVDVIGNRHAWAQFIAEGDGLILSKEKEKSDDDSYGRKRFTFKEDYPRFTFDGCDYYDVGDTWDIRTRGHLTGLKLAWKQLQEQKSNHA